MKYKYSGPVGYNPLIGWLSEGQEIEEGALPRETVQEWVKQKILSPIRSKPSIQED